MDQKENITVTPSTETTKPSQKPKSLFVAILPCHVFIIITLLLMRAFRGEDVLTSEDFELKTWLPIVVGGFIGLFGVTWLGKMIMPSLFAGYSY